MVSPKDSPAASVFWTDGRPPIPTDPGPPPARVDVAVIGAGFTGLAAALTAARAGASVAVLEAEAPGARASCRNGGMAGPSFHKLGMAGLTARYGAGKAAQIMGEGLRALTHFETLIEAERIDCAYAPTGRFRAAITEADRAAMTAEAERLNAALGLPFQPVSRDDQRAEIGSDHYRGGVVYPRDGLIQPRMLVEGLAARARAAGATLHAPCPVQEITRAAQDGRPGFSLRHPGGALHAAEVICTAGAASAPAAGPLHARVAPILTSAAVTEELPEGLVQRLTPKARGFGESARVFLWFRPTPCGRRMLFGGRIATGAAPGTAGHAARAAAFHARAAAIFPELAPFGFSHSWTGVVGYTADHAPHLGRIDGIWCAGGYCGSGVTRSLYFGDRIAKRALGAPGGETAFDDLPFPRLPFRPFAGLGARLAAGWHARADAKALAGRAP